MKVKAPSDMTVSTANPSSDLQTNPAETASPLIRFDRKTYAYIFVCLFFYILFIVCKWHNSSISCWNSFLNDGGNEKRGIVVGRPRASRSDELLVVSSFKLSQKKNGFPTTNAALGYGKTPI